MASNAENHSKINFTAEQHQILCERFEANNHPSLEERQSLASLFGVPAHNIRTWFKNKRQRMNPEWQARKAQSSKSNRQRRQRPQREQPCSSPPQGEERSLEPESPTSTSSLASRCLTCDCSVDFEFSEDDNDDDGFTCALVRDADYESAPATISRYGFSWCPESKPRDIDSDGAEENLYRLSVKFIQSAFF